jgi:hypothetical protein
MLFEGGCYRRKQLTKLFHPGVQDQIIISAVPVQTDLALAPQDTNPVDCRATLTTFLIDFHYKQQL